MKLLGLHHFAFNVKDMDRAEQFYTRVLGFRVVRRYDERLRHIELDTGNSRLALFETPDLDADPALDVLSGQGFMHHAFLTTREEFESVIEELKQHNVVIENGPIQLGNGMSIYFRDPDNNHLEIRYPVNPE